MYELSNYETEMVDGGLLPLIGVLAFVWYEAGNIQSLVRGFFDGRIDARS